MKGGHNPEQSAQAPSGGRPSISTPPIQQSRTTGRAYRYAVRGDGSSRHAFTEGQEQDLGSKTPAIPALAGAVGCRFKKTNKGGK